MSPEKSPKFIYYQAELESVKAEFLELLAAIPEEDWNRRIPGEHWTVKQTLAHVAQALQTQPEGIRRATTGHGGALLAITPVALRNWANGYIIIPLVSMKATRSSIAEEYEQAHAVLLDLLATLPDEAWSKGAKVSEYRTVEQMAHRPAEHLAEHAMQSESGAGIRERRRGRSKMTILEKGANFIWKYARHLERAIFENRFYGGPAERIVEILRSYQNQDGGFGGGLEPDLRAPDSQPLFVEFGLATLYGCKLRDADMAYKACDFHAARRPGTWHPNDIPICTQVPRADHWHNPDAELPSLDRLIGLVGLATGKASSHPWLQQAVEICVRNISTTQFTDAHTLRTAFCLLDSLGDRGGTEQLFEKLAQELAQADFFIAEAPAKGYGLTPLEFAPAPDAYCRRIFSAAQIEGHLKELKSKQEEDGGWPIQWEPPGEMASWEWRAHKTVSALATLRAYGRI